MTDYRDLEPSESQNSGAQTRSPPIDTSTLTTPQAVTPGVSKDIYTSNVESAYDNISSDGVSDLDTDSLVTPCDPHRTPSLESEASSDSDRSTCIKEPLLPFRNLKDRQAMNYDYGMNSQPTLHPYMMPSQMMAIPMDPAMMQQPPMPTYLSMPPGVPQQGFWPGQFNHLPPAPSVPAVGPPDLPPSNRRKRSRSGGRQDRSRERRSRSRERLGRSRERRSRSRERRDRSRERRSRSRNRTSRRSRSRSRERNNRTRRCAGNSTGRNSGRSDSNTARKDRRRSRSPFQGRTNPSRSSSPKGKRSNKPKDLMEVVMQRSRSPHSKDVAVLVKKQLSSPQTLVQFPQTQGLPPQPQVQTPQQQFLPMQPQLLPLQPQYLPMQPQLLSMQPQLLPMQPEAQPVVETQAEFLRSLLSSSAQGKRRLELPSLCRKSRTRVEQGDRNIERTIADYRMCSVIGDGTYGHIFKAVDIESGSVRAVKKLSIRSDGEGIAQEAVREIKLLSNLRHINIVHLVEIVTDNRRASSVDDLGPVPFYLVLTYMEHDLAGLLASALLPELSEEDVAALVRQLVKAVAYCHQQGLVHRSIQPANILVNDRGLLHLADFGQSRPIELEVPVNVVGRGDSEKQMFPGQQDTEEKQEQEEDCHLVSLWYRAPEVLLGDKRIDPKIDMWAVGCVTGELFLGHPVFRCRLTGGDDPQAEEQRHDLQLDTIAKLCGSVTPKVWPAVVNLPGYQRKPMEDFYRRRVREEFVRVSPVVCNDLDWMFQLDPRNRCTAEELLQSKWLKYAEPQMLRLRQPFECHRLTVEELKANSSAPETQPVNNQLPAPAPAPAPAPTPTPAPSSAPTPDTSLSLTASELTERILKLSQVINTLRQNPDFSEATVLTMIEAASRQWVANPDQSVALSQLLREQLLENVPVTDRRDTWEERYQLSSDAPAGELTSELSDQDLWRQM